MRLNFGKFENLYQDDFNSNLNNLVKSAFKIILNGTNIASEQIEIRLCVGKPVGEEPPAVFLTDTGEVIMIFQLKILIPEFSPIIKLGYICIKIEN